MIVLICSDSLDEVTGPRDRLHPAQRGRQAEATRPRTVGNRKEANAVTYECRVSFLPMYDSFTIVSHQTLSLYITSTR